MTVSPTASCELTHPSDQPERVLDRRLRRRALGTGREKQSVRCAVRLDTGRVELGQGTGRPQAFRRRPGALAVGEQRRQAAVLQPAPPPELHFSTPAHTKHPD